MNKHPLISIIIPFHWKYKSPEYDRFIHDLIPMYKQSYSSLEILIVLDKTERLDISKRKNVRILMYPGRTTSPAVKRDYALKFAKGEICGFIDDDAYPAINWVKNAVPLFTNTDIVAVGGPGITPPDDGYWEKLSGLVYESIFCSGAAQYRFVPLSSRFVEDYPAYNFFVRTRVLKKVKGFDNSFYGGEDTFLCLKLINEGKIRYDGSVIVYHHRRALFGGLLKQIGNVGFHRGYFAVKYPRTSRRWFYFLPSLLMLCLLILTVLTFFYPHYLLAYAGLLVFFIMLGALSVISQATVSNSLLVGIGIIAVHIYYGFNFIKGLVTKHTTN